jgi:uncharacterized protein with PQ loop repeat
MWSVDVNIDYGIAAGASLALIVLWLAPMWDIWIGPESVVRTKSTSNLGTALNYIGGLFSSILWVMYMSTRLAELVVPFSANFVGIALNASYVACYWHFAKDASRADIRLSFLAMLLFTTTAAAIWGATGSNDAVGYMAAAANGWFESTCEIPTDLTVVIMFAGPLGAAKQVIRTRSTHGMPLAPLCLTVICSLLWFAYGLYIFQIPIMIPNGLGILCGIFELVLYAWAKIGEVARK